MYVMGLKLSLVSPFLCGPLRGLGESLRLTLRM